MKYWNHYAVAMRPKPSEGEMTRLLTEHKANCRWWSWGHKYMRSHNKNRRPGKHIKKNPSV